MNFRIAPLLLASLSLSLLAASCGKNSSDSMMKKETVPAMQEKATDTPAMKGDTGTMTTGKLMASSTPEAMMKTDTTMTASGTMTASSSMMLKGSATK